MQFGDDKVFCFLSMLVTCKIQFCATVWLIESCAGRVNPHGLRVPAFAGREREPALLCVRVRGGCGLNLLRGGRGMRNSSCW